MTEPMAFCQIKKEPQEVIECQTAKEKDPVDGILFETKKCTNYADVSRFCDSSILSEMLVPEVCIKVENDQEVLPQTPTISYENAMHFLDSSILKEQGEKPIYSGTTGTKQPEVAPLSCPLCEKSFSSSKGLNSHVVKLHKTTLGPKFTCKVCGANEGSRASLRRHLKRSHNLTDIDQPELLTKKCVHCEMAFTSHVQLYEHLHSCHESELGSYHHCPLCRALLKTRVSFVRHIKRSHPDQKELYLDKFPCDDCGEMFENRQALQRHRKHSHVAVTFLCDECGAHFKHKYMLRRHKVTHTEKYRLEKSKKKEKLSCDICGHKYSMQAMLNKHMQNVHLQSEERPERTYKCNMCDKVSSSARLNRTHYRRVHMKERLKLRCSRCKLIFETAEECIEHKKTHPLKCEVCQKAFLSQDSLKEHSRIHDAPRHQCPVCQKKFVQSSNMKRHLRVHTGERPYQCPHCDRCFSDKSACNSHARVHTGAERSECPICGASFSKKQRLRYHMKMHTGIGLIMCPLCGKSHTNSYPLRKHVECHSQRLSNVLRAVGFTRLLDVKPTLVRDTLSMMLEEAVQNHHNANTHRVPFIKREEDHDSTVFTDVFNGDPGIPLPPMATFNIDHLRAALLEVDLEQTYSSNQVFGCFLIRLFRIPDFGKFEQRQSVNHLGTLSRHHSQLPQTEADELVQQCLEVVIKPELCDLETSNDDSFHQKSEASSPLMDDIPQSPLSDADNYDSLQETSAV